jgi:hypothetical protein
MSFCNNLLKYLGSSASDGLSNAEYFGLVHYYNVHC